MLCPEASQDASLKSELLSRILWIGRISRIFSLYPDFIDYPDCTDRLPISGFHRLFDYIRLSSIIRWQPDFTDYSNYTDYPTTTRIHRLSDSLILKWRRSFDLFGSFCLDRSEPRAFRVIQFSSGVYSFPLLLATAFFFLSFSSSVSSSVGRPITLALIFASISAASSGLSWRNSLADSRPWAILALP